MRYCFAFVFEMHKGALLLLTGVSKAECATKRISTSHANQLSD